MEVLFEMFVVVQNIFNGMQAMSTVTAVGDKNVSFQILFVLLFMVCVLGYSLFWSC